MNEKNSRKLLETARAKNLLCVEAIWSRFLPSYQYLKGRLDNNDLGEIIELEVELGMELRTSDRYV